jgi:ElaA protein
LLVLHRGRRAAGRQLTEANPREIHAARLDELAPRALLGILALRQAVFVVEQNCVYPDIDANDADPRTTQLWIEDESGQVVSTLRVIDQGDDGHRIGRVATYADSRGRGYAGALMLRAIELSGPLVTLSAQAYLVDWYASFGFVERGERWIEDGIEHAPMRLEVRR